MSNRRRPPDDETMWQQLSPEEQAAFDAVAAESAITAGSSSARGRRQRIAKSSLWKTANGDWHYRYDAGVTAEGKRRRPTLNFGPQRDRAAAERLALAFRDGLKRPARVSTSAVWRDFSALYVEKIVPTLARESRPTARSVITCHLDKRFGGLLLHAVREHVQAWIDEQATSDPPVPLSTIKQRYGVLRAVLRAAVRRKVITAEHLPDRPEWPRARLNKRPHEALTFTATEQRQLLDCSPWPLRAALALGFHVGLRPGEIVGLEWPLVDLESGRLTVRQQAQHGDVVPLKTEASAAVIQMPPELVAVLAAYRRVVRREALAAGHARRFLFEHEGAALSHARLRSRQLYPLLERLKLTQRGLHACRRAFSDRLLEAGATLPEIQAALRHRTLDATQRYLSQAPSALVTAAIARAAREAATAKLDERDINRAGADVIPFPSDDE